jgi:hypothetical protein
VKKPAPSLCHDVVRCQGYFCAEKHDCLRFIHRKDRASYTQSVRSFFVAPDPKRRCNFALREKR